MNNPGLFQAKWNLGRLPCAITRSGAAVFLAMPAGRCFCGYSTNGCFIYSTPSGQQPRTWLQCLGSSEPATFVCGGRGNPADAAVRANGCSRRLRCARRFLVSSTILLLLLFIRMLFSKLAAQMGWQHNSPSMVIRGAHPHERLLP